MKSSALIPLVVLMVAYSAQAAESPNPAGPPVSHFQGSCDSDPEGTKFAERACYTTYDPGQAGFGSSYRPPICDKSNPVTQRQRELLAKAYSRAPDYVKAKLCRLTQLFVTRSYQGLWGSWGFWEGPDRPPGKGIYIAISDHELGPASKRSVADAENEIVRELLGFKDGGRHHRPRLASLRPEAAPDPALTVLAALAHELGHALLADANADGTDPRHPRRKVSGPPQSACFEDAVLGSWDAERFHRHMTRWVNFGEQNQNRQINPKVEYNLERLKTAAHNGKVDVANDAISNVYRSGEFVSFFASLRPEEDAVETYKYKVLADTMPNQTIGFRLRDGEINVLDSLKSGKPAKKMECLRDLGFLTGKP
jgi:hypothetical protein